MLFSIFFQLLGYSGTCTQGNTAAFFTGAVFSFPLLVLVFLALVSIFRRPVERSISVNLGLMAFASLALVLCAVNFEMVYGVLVRGLTACGVEYSSPGDSTREDILIALIYGAAPAITGLISIFNLWRTIIKHE